MVTRVEVTRVEASMELAMRVFFGVVAFGGGVAVAVFMVECAVVAILRVWNAVIK